MAARPRRDGPSGFSFDASLMMPAGSRPSSRATSSMGRPGWYTGRWFNAGLMGSGVVILQGLDDFFNVDAFGDDITDEGNFFGVGGPRFDGEVVDFGRNLIAVRLRQQHRNLHGLNDLEHTRAGTQTAGQDDARHFFAALPVNARARGKHDVLAITGGDEQRAGLEELNRVLRAHRADDHVVHERLQRGRHIEQFGAQFFANQIHRRVAQHLLMRNDAEQFQPFALETAANEPGDFGNFFLEHLVDDDADDFDALLFKQCLVEADFVNRFADAALGDDDDLATERFRDLGVGQIENRADARVPGTFAQHKILFPRHAVERVLDALDQRFVVRRFKVFAGKGRLDGNGAHVHQRAVQAIHRVHEHDVLVNFLLLDFNETLADGLDVRSEEHT